MCSPYVPRMCRARVNISTTISLARELSINVGEFTQPPLTAGTRLYDMCQLGALHKHTGDAPPFTASVATHTYVCARAHPFYKSNTD
jgi:hypothetical protein